MVLSCCCTVLAPEVRRSPGIRARCTWIETLRPNGKSNSRWTELNGTRKHLIASQILHGFKQHRGIPSTAMSFCRLLVPHHRFVVRVAGHAWIPASIMVRFGTEEDVLWVKMLNCHRHMARVVKLRRIQASSQTVESVTPCTDVDKSKQTS